MGFESFGNYENLGNNEKPESLKYDFGFLSDGQNRIENQARQYVITEQEKGRNMLELTGGLK